MTTSTQLPRERRVRTVLVLTAAGLAVAGAAVVTVTSFTGQTREQVIAQRSAEVMPFDLAATTHHFSPTADGGVQTVVADDPTDRQQIELIRQHLRDEAAAFTRGEFDDPAQIHGADMPGLATLEANAHRLTVTHHVRDDGAELRYATDDPTLVAALHDWFAAQTADHQGHAG